MKAFVFLGLRHAILAKQWCKEYKEGKRNDTMLYGYGNAATHDFKIDYCSFNRIEKFLFKENILGKLYLYCLKLPYLLMKYDVVWTHVDRDALFIAKLKSIPVLGRLFCKHIANFVWLIDHTQHYSETKKKKIGRLLHKIDKILYLSTSEHEEFIKHYHCEERKLVYTRYGINFEAYGPDAIGIKPKGFAIEDFILSVGTDQHRDLQLLDLVAESNKDKTFVVCSGSPEHHKQVFKSKNIILLKATYNEMVYLYRKCKFVVIPLKFNFHASGITTLLEAAAAKKAVVINYTPGLEDYGIDNSTCLFSKLEDPSEFNERINILWNNMKLREHIVTNAYDYLRPEFNTVTYSKIYIDLSREILKG